jgi:hypothetical protein
MYTLKLRICKEIEYPSHNHKISAFIIFRSNPWANVGAAKTTIQDITYVFPVFGTSSSSFHEKYFALYNLFCVQSAI